MIYQIGARQHLIISVILTALNLINWSNHTLAAVGGCLFLIYHALVLGQWLFLKNSWTCKFLYGLLILTSTAAILESAAFYFFKLNDLAISLVIIVLALALMYIPKKYPLVLEIELPKIKIDWAKLFLSLSYLLIVVVIFRMIGQSQTSKSIRTPWEVLPQQIFILYFLATFLLFFIVRYFKSTISLLLISIHYFLSFSLAAIIYQIGFDYDPFIHRANLKLILENGTLLPKPFYYLGQYGLIIFIYKLTLIPINLIDKFLVPIMSAVYLPATIYYAFKDNFKADSRLLLISILTVLILPFSVFISTTPQALADLFFLITVLLALYYHHLSKTAVWPLGLLTLMCLLIHPLAGIPLFFFFVLLVMYLSWQDKIKIPAILKRGILWETLIIACLALPTAFLINSLTLSELKVGLSQNWIISIGKVLAQFNWHFYYRHFISFFDLTYSYYYNLWLIILALTLAGWYFIKQNNLFKRYFVYLLAIIFLAVNYLLLKGSISFFSLVSYEQINYPNRLAELMVFILLPSMIICFYYFYRKLLTQKFSTQILATVLISLAVSCSFYLSYPRVDQITEDHGYSTSAIDVKTVGLIERLQAKPNGDLVQPYVVLASQPVSAAVIQELGFKYYYNNVFFYPVPTGRKLYQLYEDLAYAKKPTLEIIKQVRKLTGVNEVYFVINDYWLNAASRIDQEKQLADKWFSVDGKDYVFKYFK